MKIDITKVDKLLSFEMQMTIDELEKVKCDFESLVEQFTMAEETTQIMQTLSHIYFNHS